MPSKEIEIFLCVETLHEVPKSFLEDMVKTKSRPQTNVRLAAKAVEGMNHEMSVRFSPGAP